MVGLVELLEILQTTHQSDNWQRTLNIYQPLATAITKFSDATGGGWWQVVTEANKESNYIESSGTSMFVYAILKGLRLGYLENITDSVDFVSVAMSGYDWLMNNALVKNSNGTLDWDRTVDVCSLNSTADYDYYTHRPINFNSLIGSSAFVLASVEVELRQK